MKKSLVITLALVFVLGIVSTAFAAANPFVDVPAKHWAYESVAKLAKAGIVDGYGDGTFRGDKNMTRYEMAQIVAKAMANSEKADAALKADIAKLQVEFATELNNLGVRVAKLEKNQSTVKMGGETRLRYRWADSDTLPGTKAFDWRQRLHLNAAVSSNIDFTARLYASNTIGQADHKNAEKDQSFDADRFFFTLKGMLGIDKMTIGKTGLTTGKGFSVDDSDDNDGITVAHKLGKADLFAFHTVQADNVTFNGFNVAYAPTKNFDLTASYFDHEAGLGSKGYEFGTSYNFGNGFSVVGAYADTETVGQADGSAWVAQLTWNKNKMYNKQVYGTNYVVNKAKAHDYGFAINYRDIDAYGLINNGGHSTYSANVKVTGVSEVSNTKAWYFVYQNVVQKNLIMTVDYQKLTDKADDSTDKAARVFFEFYF